MHTLIHKPMYRYLLTLFITALLLYGTASAAENTLRMGSYINARSIGISQVIRPWADAVQAETGNAVTIVEYWGGSLGKSPAKQFELVKSGVLDIAWILPGYTPGQFPEMGLFELPFLFDTALEAATVGWQLHDAGLLTGFDGVRLIGFFSTAPNGLFMRRSIDTPLEMNGYKIRAVGAIHSDWLNTLGAAAQTMSAIDMNQALGRDIVDGGIQGWSGMRTFGSFPLVEQAWDIPVGMTPFLLLINEESWQRQPASVQRAMLHHGGLRIARSSGRAYAAINQQIRAALREADKPALITPDAATQQALVERTQALHTAWMSASSDRRKTYRAAQMFLSQLRAETPPVSGGTAP
ncbi:MAG: TRAP transporter substrate-binding protein DctP [Luminiphilus sp.]